MASKSDSLMTINNSWTVKTQAHWKNSPETIHFLKPELISLFIIFISDFEKMLV